MTASITPLISGKSAGGAKTGAGGVARYLAREAEQYRSGPEDAKAPSMWLGSGAQVLGLAGQVESEALIAILEGRDPCSGAALTQKQNNKNLRLGWDLTLSPPKDFSAVWATADPEMRAQLEAAHDAAVRRAASEIEKLVEGRQGKGGSEKVAVQAVIAAHRHSTSRNLDPQIHGHLAVANMGRRADGKWVSLDVRKLYQSQKIVGALYRTELASELRKLGLEPRAAERTWGLGVPEKVTEAWSSRRKEIEAAVGKDASPDLAEAAALRTRSAKKHVDAATLHEGWREQAADLGWDGQTLDPLPEPGAEPLTFEQHLSKRLEVHFGMDAVLKETDLTVAVLEAAALVGMTADEGIAQVEAAQAGLVRLTDSKNKIWFTTPEHMLLSREIRRIGNTLAASDSHALPLEAIKAAQARVEAEVGYALSNEQAAALYRICSGSDLEIIRGAAGAGKTTLMATACRAWEAAGYRIVGLAPSGKAADQLAADAKINASTIHSFLLREESRPTLSRGDIVIIDEAGMVDSRLLHSLVVLVEKAGAKLIPLGDDFQIAPVQAGRPFAALIKDHGCAELVENRRQQNAQQRDATDLLRAGQAAQALEKYAAQGLLHIIEDGEAVHAALIDAWREAGGTANPSKNLITAAKNADVQLLNELARAEMRTAGLLGADRKIEGREFAPGDRVVILENSKEAGVKNGQLATISKIEMADGKPRLALAFDNGTQRILDSDNFDLKKLARGYATTVHKSQGATVSQTFNLIDERMTSKNLGYVQLTRHREAAHVFISETSIERLADAAGIEEEEEIPLEKKIALIAEKMSKEQEHFDISDFEFSEEPPTEKEIENVKRASIYQSDLEQARPETPPEPVPSVRDLPSIHLVRDLERTELLLHEDALDRVEEGPAPDLEMRRPGAGLGRAPSAAAEVEVPKEAQAQRDAAPGAPEQPTTTPTHEQEPDHGLDLELD